MRLILPRGTTITMGVMALFYLMCVRSLRDGVWRNYPRWEGDCSVAEIVWKDKVPSLPVDCGGQHFTVSNEGLLVKRAQGRLSSVRCVISKSDTIECE